MSNSTSLLAQIATAQAQKEVTANGLFDAASPSMFFGRHAEAASALTWGYYGGSIVVDGVLTAIANGTVALTVSSTNYVERTRAGVVSANTTAFTAGRVPLYAIITSASAVVSYTDYRESALSHGLAGRLNVSVAGGANVTLTAAQTRNAILNFTGLLTASINIIVPDGPQIWLVSNNTTGAYTLTVKTSAGTGVVVAQAYSAVLFADGTNVVAPNATPTSTPVLIQIACSDETTLLTASTAKVTFRAPYAFTLTAVRGSLSEAATGGTLLTVDVNEGGTTLLSTKLTFDASEKTTTTAATPCVISDSAIADDAEITIDVDTIGSTLAGKGLKVTLIGTKP
jgi:hypothetical protein